MYQKVKNIWQLKHRDLDYVERHDYTSATWTDNEDLDRYNGLIGIDHISLSDEQILEFFYDDPWPNITNKKYAIHRIRPSWIIPEHRDLYLKYRTNHNIDRVTSITRIVVFLEDWSPGHILQIENKIITPWRAGDWVSWIGDTPHMAANLGSADRYTLQITGINDV